MGAVVALIARTGLSERLSKVAAYILGVLLAVALVWAGVAVFREWVATGKQDAVELDRNDISLQASNRVIEAMAIADANQQARDEIADENEKELRHAATVTPTAAPVGNATASVLERMRQQQAAGRRN